MPNWCSNYVTLTNEDTSKIDALEATLTANDEGGETNVLNALIPRPIEEEDNWYSWNCENWGTKWDISVQDWGRDGPETIWINFDSAWSPPVTAYETLFEEGWTVDAEYYEPGMGFVGQFTDGSDDYYEFNFENEDWCEGIADSRIDFAGLDEEYENWKEWQEDDEDEKEVD